MHGNEFKLQVFPNPTSGIIRWSEIANKVSLFDAAGRRLMSAEKVQELNISKFQNGIYFLETEYNGKTSTFKIVKK